MYVSGNRHESCLKWCRWLKDWGIALSSERQQRKRGKELVGENIAAEAVPFTFPLKSGGEEIRAAPMVYTPDLLEKIFNRKTACKTTNKKGTLQLTHYSCIHAQTQQVD